MPQTERRLDTLERRLGATRANAADRARSDTAILDWLETFATRIRLFPTYTIVETVGDNFHGRDLRRATRVAMDAMAAADAGRKGAT